MKTMEVYCSNLGCTKEVQAGSSLQSIAQKWEAELGFKALNCRIDNETVSLSETIQTPSQIEFAGISHESGMRTYVRTLSFVIAKAASDVLPGVQLHLLHSLSNGYYCTLRNGEAVRSEDIARIKARMNELIVQDLVFEEHTVPVQEAVDIFSHQGMQDKVDLIETSGQLYYTYYSLEGYADSFYGSLAPSTGYLYLYDLIPYMNGVLIRVPDQAAPNQLAPIEEQPKLKEIIERQTRLLTMLNLQNIGSFNRAVENKNIHEIIHVSEAVQEKEIAQIAQEIAGRYNKGIRIILVSGPSSSGKTTFTKRLRIQLLTNFLHPHSISLDDYFVDRDQTPLDEKGEYDFESLYALDLDLFNKDLAALLEGREVELPTFDFNTGHRKYKGKKLQLQEGEILLLEGIHALNPALIPNISTEKTYKVYVSALTAISLDKHNRIPSTDNRLLRRIVRDARYRGYSAVETLRRWSSVRKGEEKWVFPHQENADAMFNSAMIYELAILRIHAEPLLREVPRSAPEYCEAKRLLRFLEQINYIPARIPPSASLLREFVGGSSFTY